MLLRTDTDSRQFTAGHALTSDLRPVSAGGSSASASMGHGHSHGSIFLVENCELVVMEVGDADSACSAQNAFVGAPTLRMRALALSSLERRTAHCRLLTAHCT